MNKLASHCAIYPFHGAAVRCRPSKSKRRFPIEVALASPPRKDMACRKLRSSGQNRACRAVSPADDSYHRAHQDNLRQQPSLIPAACFTRRLMLRQPGGVGRAVANKQLVQFRRRFR